MTASMRSRSSGNTLCLLLALVAQAESFLAPTSGASRPFGRLWAEDTEKAAPAVTGADLEMMLQEWDTPLVVDAYATWCVSDCSACGTLLFYKRVDERIVEHVFGHRSRQTF